MNVENHINIDKVYIHIRKFDDKTNTVELIDRLSKDSKVINMDVIRGMINGT